MEKVMTDVVNKLVAEASAQVVSNVNGRPVTRGQLAAVFDRVKDAEHWKNPIDALVVLEKDEVPLMEEAIVFFTGSVPSIVEVGIGGAYHVTAAGYFETIGA